MQEDDKVRLPSDKLFDLDEEVKRKALEAFRFNRLTKLTLTEWDERFLKSLKIAI